MIDSNKIIALAKEKGYDKCGIISVQPFLQYKKDLDYDRYGKDFYIHYDPKEAASYAKSIIVLIKSYQPYKQEAFSKDHIFIDSYYVSSNANYQKAKEIADYINAKGYNADSSPKIPYRHCAFRAGFGKRGMNGLLIDDDFGSYINIQCILTDIAFTQTNSFDVVDTCIRCGQCKFACRTQALLGTGEVLQDRCIRHYMPAKRYVPSKIRDAAKNRLLGCEDCRLVCPENKKIKKIDPPEELIEACYLPVLLNKNHPMHKKHIKLLQKYCGKNEIRPQRLLQSAIIIAGNIGDKKYLPILTKLKEEYIQEHFKEYINWAIESIKSNNT